MRGYKPIPLVGLYRDQEGMESDVSNSFALPLISINEDADSDTNMEVNSDALKILRNLDSNIKVSVVCVCGLYRSGKSALMNWLLDIDTWSEQRNGFVVGPSINRCTRGIWMWGAPKKSKLPSGEECYVIVLDTEGIGGVESNAQYDARIFSLALLLCSSLIYNSMGSIDEAAISNLSFVAQLSQHIHLTQPTQPSDETGTASNGHDESSGFARSYGESEPKEDFATVFAKVMQEYLGETYDHESTGTESGLQEKEEHINDFLDRL